LIILAPKKSSEMLYEKAASKNKRIKIFEKMLHEIHNEPCQEVLMVNFHIFSILGTVSIGY
jgi:alpha-beta hydrolase superfamily lysophospholipase